ncbi:MAG: zinc ABC transporter substrate-binding protein, partial [Candidatus Thioglobus sp.]|uniref:metal ABC transporter solute-binding protein, Zn/Mn family n=1 Tax=Candidatus Thioglobus sp. TaxID=2026721 RepID=UPI002624C279
DEHDEHDEHSQSSQNYHVWLNINFMQQFSHRLTKRLIRIDPLNTNTYQLNLKALNHNLEQLKHHINQQLSTLATRKLVGYSTAFEHFNQAHSLTQSYSITNQHEQRLSIYKIIHAKNFIRDNQSRCLLSTISVPNKRLKTLTEGLSINTASIDIIGFDIASGAKHYPKLLTNVSNKIATCLQ